jgi:hypothetical protein
VPETPIIADNPKISATIPACCSARQLPANSDLLALLADEDSVFCKQEVTGSIPVGSIRKLPASDRLLMSVRVSLTARA